MNVELSKSLLLRWLSDRRRKLTAGQLRIVSTALHTCSLPLYTRLVLEKVQKWSSYTPLNQCVLEPTVKGMISAFFEHLETQHGRILIQHALGYLTASRAGMSESEIEDVLSLDDVVLNDVFSFWLPPVRRLPSLLWTRIQDNLHSYLVEREADGCKVLCWYHKEFRDAANAHFLGNKETCIARHKVLADYFLGVWGAGKKKPYKHNNQQLTRISINENCGSADRKVSSQPLRYKCTKTGKIRYNVRKLRELPYHLYKSNQQDKLSKELLCNYQWLHTKLYATSLTDVLDDFALASREGWCRQIKVIRSVLILAGSALGKIPNTLAVELVGRLKSDTDTETILGQCLEEGIKDCQLLPAFQCFDAPDEPAYALLEGHKGDVLSITFSRNYDKMYSLSLDGIIIIWEVGNQEFIKEISLPTDAITSLSTKSEIHVVTSDSKKELIIVDMNCEHNPLLIFDAKIGSYLYSVTGSFGVTGGTHHLVKTSQYIIKDGIVLDVDCGAKIANISAFNGINESTEVLLTHNEEYMIYAFNESLTSVSIGSNKVVCRLACDSTATKLAMTRDDKVLVSGFSDEGVIIIYDVMCAYQLNIRNTHNYMHTFGKGHFTKRTYLRKIFKLILSRDGQTALLDLSRTFLFSLNLSDLTSLQYILPIPIDSVAITRISDSNFSGNMIIVALVNDLFCIWKVGHSNVLKLLPSSTHQLMPNSFIMSCRHPVCILAKHDYIIKLWDIEQELNANKTQVYRFPTSVDYMRIAPGTYWAFIKTKSVDYGRRASAIYIPPNRTHFGLDIRCLNTNKHHTYLPYGEYGELIDMDISLGAKRMVILTKQAESNAFIIDIKTGRVIDKIYDKHNTLRTVKISMNGKYILLEAKPRGMSGEVQIWNINQKHACSVLKNLIHDAHHAIFTNNSTHVICIGGKRRIGAYSLIDNMGNIQWSKSRLTAVHSIRAIPKRHDCFLVTGSDSHHLSMLTLNKRTTSIVWNLNENKDIITIEGVSHDGIMNISKDGCRAVDSKLQVYNLFNGERFPSIKLKTLCSQVSSVHVLLTYDGQYVIWADTHPTFCIKVARVDTGALIAEAGTHSEVRSLGATDYGYTITCGCVDGNIFIFKLHKETQLQDSGTIYINHNYEKINSPMPLDKTLSWPPLTLDTINSFDKTYRSVSSEDSTSSSNSDLLPSAGLDLQKALTSLNNRKSVYTLSRIKTTISMPDLNCKSTTLPKCT